MSGAGGSKTNKKTAKSKSPHAQPAYGAPKIRFWIYRPGHPATLSLYVRVEFDEQRGIAFSAPPRKTVSRSLRGNPGENHERIAGLQDTCRK